MKKKNNQLNIKNNCKNKNILFIKVKNNKLNKRDLCFDYAKNKNNYKFKIQTMNHINQLYKR